MHAFEALADRGGAGARSKRLRKLVGFLRDETATAALEFSMLAPIFFGVLLAVLAAGTMELARAQLDHASEIGKRAVMTGQATNSATLKTSIVGAIGGLISPANLMVNLSTYGTLAAASTSIPTLTYDNNGNVTNSWNAQFGGSGSIMVLQLVYQFPVFGSIYSLATQQNGAFLLVSTQVFIRE